MSTSILSSPYAAALGACVFIYFVVYPVVVYFRDVNGQYFTLYMPHTDRRLSKCSLFHVCCENHAD